MPEKTTKLTTGLLSMLIAGLLLLAAITFTTAIGQTASLSPFAISDPINCTNASSPVAAFEISRGQSPDDYTTFLNELVSFGYTVGTVDLSAGTIPSCVDILIIMGLAGNNRLSSPYTTTDATMLRNWAAAGHGLMISSDWGFLKGDTQPLFQEYGYTLLGDDAVIDPTDADPSGPNNSWVIYQVDNFGTHPIFDGVTAFEMLRSAWLTPATNALVITDADANPANMPVMAAFRDGSGCVLLATDSNWLGEFSNAYALQDNTRAGRQAVAWLTGCVRLRLTKTADLNPVPAGNLLRYTITASNFYTDTLTGITITDTIPAGTSFVAASSPFSGPDANGVVTWNVGTLLSDNSAVVTLTVRVDAGLGAGTTILNTAYVASNEGLTDSAVLLVDVSNPPTPTPTPTSSPTPTSTPTSSPTPTLTPTATPERITANAGGPYTITEGSNVTLDASSSFDPNGGSLSYAWDLDNDGLFDDGTAVTVVFSASNRDDGVYPVSVQVTGNTGSATDTTTVTVNNAIPQVTLMADSWDVLIGETAVFTGTFTDPGTLDTHTILWNFGDGATTNNTLTASHTFNQTGQYLITLTITDDDGGVGQATGTMNVTTPPTPSFVFLPVVQLNYCIPTSHPADIILLLDSSGSMANPTSSGNTSRLAAAQAAATDFLNIINLPPDQASIIDFDSEARVLVPLTSDRAALIASLQSLVAEGLTRIDLALATARQELSSGRHNPAHTAVIILLTDGKPFGVGEEPVIAEANAAKAAGIIIYTIGLGDSINETLLKTIATDPTHFYHSPTADDLSQIYAEIAGFISCPGN
ncbi:MAG: VWA domain-containing protein [Chloroflexi bacterium]|nr:MAG: VWA domain-containing protein [Chloroflexota bacterium]